MSNGTISVILPNYNYAHFLETRVDSVLKQKYKISELIFLDDCSTDNSVNVIEKTIKTIKQEYPDIKVIFDKNKKNSGSVFSQWKKGISLASSEYIWIAEIDDSCSNYFLKVTMQSLLNDDSVILSYTNSKLIGSVNVKDKVRQIFDVFRSRRFPISGVQDGQTVLNNSLAVYNSIPNVSGCVFRNVPALTNFLEDVKKYKLSGDWLFYTKLCKIGKIAYSPRKLNYHRLSASSVTNKVTKDERLIEMIEIHNIIKKTNTLKPTTIRRINKLEAKLKKNWL